MSWLIGSQQAGSLLDSLVFLAGSFLVSSGPGSAGSITTARSPQRRYSRSEASPGYTSAVPFSALTPPVHWPGQSSADSRPTVRGAPLGWNFRWIPF
jgi:hypothetical protein